MVIDTSAILAVLLGEPEGDGFIRRIAAGRLRLMSAASRVEAMIVIETRKGESGRRDLERFLEEAAIEIVAVTADQAEAACAAFRRYGKGRDRANLNFGDVFVYALAKTTGEPLLFKGTDFAATDLPVVVDEP